MKRALIFALTLIGVATAAQAQNTGWRLLGYKTVGAGTDTDVIRVNSNRTFRQLRLCSLNAPINMRDFDVRFRNGGREDVNVRSRIGAGRCTRNIDLHGRQRHITQVRLRYERLDRSRRPPLIRVMGL